MFISKLVREKSDRKKRRVKWKISTENLIWFSKDIEFPSSSMCQFVCCVTEEREMKAAANWGTFCGVLEKAKEFADIPAHSKRLPKYLILRAKWEFLRMKNRLDEQTEVSIYTVSRRHPFFGASQKMMRFFAVSEATKINKMGNLISENGLRQNRFVIQPTVIDEKMLPRWKSCNPILGNFSFSFKSRNMINV